MTGDLRIGLPWEETSANPRFGERKISRATGLLPVWRRRFGGGPALLGEVIERQGILVGDDDIGALSTLAGFRADRRPDAGGGKLTPSELREGKGSGVPYSLQPAKDWMSMWRDPPESFGA